MKSIHNPVFVVIDGLNSRVVAEGITRRISWRKEWYGGPKTFLLGFIQELLGELPVARLHWEIGIYAGPGAFSRLRKGVLLGHWLARTIGGNNSVRVVPQSALNGTKRLSIQWEKFPKQELPKIRYGKQPRITKSRKT